MPVKQMLKRAGALALDRAGGLAVVRWQRRFAVRILMYHRFPEAGRAACEVHCAHLRAHYRALSLAEAVKYLASGNPPPRHSVVVTIDDGYGDACRVAWPVLRQYGIPATIFVVTDFLDRRLWLWPDQVVWSFRATPLESVEVPLPAPAAPLRLALSAAGGRQEASEAVLCAAKRLRNEDRLALMRDLPRLLRVSLPEQPPEEFEPLTWEEVRKMAAQGAGFGSHTCSHPILSKGLSREELHHELAASKRRLEEELGSEAAHFCYPNGKSEDFNEETVTALRATGYRAAVCAIPGLNHAPTDLFRLRRIGADFETSQEYFRRRLAGLKVA